MMMMRVDDACDYLAMDFSQSTKCETRKAFSLPPNHLHGEDTRARVSESLETYLMVVNSYFSVTDVGDARPRLISPVWMGCSHRSFDSLTTKTNTKIGCMASLYLAQIFIEDVWKKGHLNCAEKRRRRRKWLSATVTQQT